jgi:hypothetical protein
VFDPACQREGRGRPARSASGSGRGPRRTFPLARNQRTRGSSSIDARLRRMPTYIYFAGAGMHVEVDEDPSRVAEAFTSAGGLPFRLTSQGQLGEVYINPAAVAFWSASESVSQPGVPQSSPPRTREREPVTDIWGKPLRKKRPR